MKSPFLTSLSPSERRRSVRQCPRCRYINKDPRALFCKMCRADLQKRDPRRAKIMFGLLGTGILAFILLRTNALNYAIDKAQSLSANLGTDVSQKVDTATRLPQDTYVPTVIGPANSNPLNAPTPPPAPQNTQAPAQAQPQSSQTTNNPQPAATSFPAASTTNSAAEHLATAAAISQAPDPSAEALQKAIDHLKAVPPSAPQYAESQAILKRLEIQAKRGQPEPNALNQQTRAKSKPARKKQTRTRSH